MWWLLAGCSARPTAERWLEAVARGDDERAFAALDVPVPPPGGFDLERFRKRVARLGLREATEVTWTREDRGWGRVSLEGTVEVAGLRRPLALSVVGGQVRGLSFGELPLVPQQDYVIVPDPRPVEPLEVPDLATRRGAAGLVVSGTLPDAGSLTVRARCLTPGGWAAGAIVGQVGGPFQLTVDVPEGDPCQLGLHFAGTTLRGAVVCAGDAVRPGPCDPAPVPDPTAPAVELTAVAARWSPSGVTIDATLRAHVPQPAHGAFESAVLTTTLTCPGGRRPVTHTRPLTDEWLEPGVSRALGAPMVVHAEGRPCALSLDYRRDDHYDRVELALFDGCVAQDGAVRAGPCAAP